jgi:thioredoxin reductase (NADPH)
LFAIDDGTVRGDGLGRSMSDYLIREIEATANITVRLHTEVSDGDGAERLASLTVRDRRDGPAEQVQAAALFALIGGEPRTQWLPGTVQLREGYVLTGRDVDRDGAGPARWLPDRARPAGDLDAGSLRGRRRPLPVDQAGRLGGR